MSTLLNLLIAFYVVISILVIYIWVLIPVLHKPGSQPHRLYSWLQSDHASQWFYRQLRRVVGISVADSLARAYQWTFNEQNPLVQIFFVVLYGVSTGLFYHQVYLKYLLETRHRYPVPLLILVGMFVYYKVCATDPGTLNKDNIYRVMADLRLKEYDNVLFHERQPDGTRPQCRTCEVVKPARSKHCSICKRCVLIADHHCIWINGCVGYYNRRWFWLFLLTMQVVAVYGVYMMSIVIHRLLYVEYQQQGALMTRKYFDVYGKVQEMTAGMAILVLVGSDIMLVALNIFGAIIALMVGLFLYYHTWLILQGTTSNEQSKWDSLKWHLQHSNRTGWRQDLLAAKEHGGYSRGWWLNVQEVMWPTQFGDMQGKKLK